MWRRPAIALIVVLAACDRFEDTGQVCVVPEQVECQSADDSGGNAFAGDRRAAWCPTGLGNCDCLGTYPENQVYQVQAKLGVGGGGNAVKIKCDVKLDGDHQLLVKASYWEQAEEADMIFEPATETTCETPVLTVGEWTLRYGDGEVVFRVGDDDQQDIACVFGEP
jgi:hypothetical protein